MAQELVHRVVVLGEFEQRHHSVAIDVRLQELELGPLLYVHGPLFEIHIFWLEIGRLAKLAQHLAPFIRV